MLPLIENASVVERSPGRGRSSCNTCQWQRKSFGPEFLCTGNGASASCWLQRGSHQADNGVLNLSSAGERRAVSLTGCKLLQPDFLPVERKDLHNRAAEHEWAETSQKQMQAAKGISHLEGPEGRNPMREEGPAWLCPVCLPLSWFLMLNPRQQCEHKPHALMVGVAGSSWQKRLGL